MMYLQSGKQSSNGKNIGIALGGGGPLGLIYEIGVLHALEDALQGVDLTDLHSYIGVSAGAYNAAFLASGFKPSQTREMLVQNESATFNMSPASLIRVSYRELLTIWRLLPGAYLHLLRSLLRHPKEINLLDVMAKVSRALPPAIFDTTVVEAIMEELFINFGTTNDFRDLDRKLFVVATQLDTGKVVRFGDQGHDHIPISTALQASQAVPGIFPPVKIDGEHYIDGGLKKSFHASALFEEGADFLFCVNPLVPYDKRLVDTGEGRKAKSLMESDWRSITYQGVAQIVHSRMWLGLEQYKTLYPDRELLLIEPSSGDETMFFSNIWSFRNRRKICEHAYESTMRDLADHQKKLRPMLLRHGIRMNTKVINEFRSPDGSQTASKKKAA
jgi:predicted acylesterase/phospholipase RssA